MAYIPDWEPLGDALKRVMETGASEEEAKTDLCRAVADGKIHVRVRIARSDRLFRNGNVGVPPHLKPGDLDWVQSRPFARWPIGPKLGEHYSWISGWENWPLDLIELWTADVIEVLCGTQSGTVSLATAGVETAATKALATHLKSNPQLSRADAAEWCKTSGYSLSDRGFQNRVWPEARVHAGLPKKGPPGRKRESTR